MSSVGLEHLDTLALDTGDIVLFDRPCFSMSPLGAFLCLASKTSTKSRWDHIGVVLRAQDGQLMLLEAALKGVVAYPLKERLRRSKSNAVAVRKLLGVDRQYMHAKANEFARQVIDRPYQSSIISIASTGISTFAKQKRHNIHKQIMECENRLAQIQQEMHAASELKAENENIQSSIEYLKKDLHNSRRSFFEASDDSSEFFCSKLVAGMYKNLDLIESFPPPSEYLPVHFSQDEGKSIALRNSAKLGSEIMVKFAHLKDK
jgi:hypothetical protein